MSLRHALREREREHYATGFTRILQNLIQALPGVAGAALVDEMGESVDYAGVLDSFEIRLAAAHVQIELRNAGRMLLDTHGVVRFLTTYAQKRTYLAMRIVNEYCLILIFVGGGHSNLSTRALAQAEFDIRIEAGWGTSPDIEPWVRLKVDARPHDRWRPCRVQVAGAWQDVEVIGCVVGLSDGERGFRVRTRTGAEMTLIRERQGHWYTDVRY